MRDKVQICIQICQAMQHLAGHQIVHGDVALRNILVQSLDPVMVKVNSNDTCAILDSVRRSGGRFRFG